MSMVKMSTYGRTRMIMNITYIHAACVFIAQVHCDIYTGEIFSIRKKNVRGKGENVFKRNSTCIYIYTQYIILYTCVCVYVCIHNIYIRISTLIFII